MLGELMAFIQHSAEVSSATHFPSTAAALDVHVMENTPLMKVIMLSSIMLESILIDFIRTDIKYLVLFKDSDFIRALTCLAIWAFTSDSSSFRRKVDSHDLDFWEGVKKETPFDAAYPFAVFIID